MANRKSTRKQKKQNQIIMGIVGGVILIAVIFGVVTQNTQDTVSTLPLEISVQAAYKYFQDDGFILDVRTLEEWNDGHVPGATLIPLNELEARLSELPQDEEIVVICRSGNRSAAARDILLNAGFENVTSVAGGFNEWVANGYPAE
ncbi:MAG: rhodanese-like domain-containing protein [Anaerolineales bacterium]